MPERNERTPLSREVIKHLRTISRRGPVNKDDPRNGALHGLSIEALRDMITTGVLRGHSFETSETGYKKGDLGVYPTPQLADKIGHLTDTSIRELLEVLPMDGTTNAIWAAENIAQIHAFLTQLRIPLTDHRAASDAACLIDDEFDFLNRTRLRGRFSLEEIVEAVNHARLRRGFLVGISPEVAETPGITLNNGDPGSGDIRVDTAGKGLSYRLISGITPLGPVEEEFLQKLLGS